MNPDLDRLHPYPFERLNELLAGVVPDEGHEFIPLSLGEPKHPAPEFLVNLYQSRESIEKSFGTYPTTKGIPELRIAIAEFVNRRFALGENPIDPETEVLPVNGTREALFAIAQALIDGSAKTATLMPNPFYQIYEGAAILAGSRPVYVPCTKDTDFNPDFSAVSTADWDACSLLYICSPGNPTGAVMTIEAMQTLIGLSDKHDFVIVSDECYSEIYEDESNPPPGLLQAASLMGRADYRNCLAFNSLSKRSNLPGLRSGYACGDARLIEKFLLYRTYHGSAMPTLNQVVSAAAWQDEDHVIDNRILYREKYDAVLDILGNVWPMQRPPASFYLWPETPIDDEEFAKRLYQSMNIKVVPGSYLSRVENGQNPGAGRVRMALVATLAECVAAAHRIKDFIQHSQYK